MRDGWFSFQLDRFQPEARQSLALGILEVAAAQPELAEMAVHAVRVESEAHLNTILSAAESIQDSKLKEPILMRALRYLLDERSDPMPIPEKAVMLLNEALEDKSPDKPFSGYITSALNIIGNYRIESMLPQVCRIALESPDLTVREDAVRCLDKLQSRERVPTLIECLKDSSTKVRERASGILNRMREYEEQKRAWEGLLGEGVGAGAPTPSAALVEMLESEDLEVRLAAIRSLGRLADPNTLPVLVKIMAESADEEKAAARAAIDKITQE
jgi:HEAT repeat protein